MASNSFDIVGLAPAELAHPGIALGVARAGGVGLLDLEFVVDEARATRSFERLLAGTTGRVGLRVISRNAALAATLIGTAGDRVVTTVLAGAVTGFGRLRRDAGVRSSDLCLGEITAAKDAEAAEEICDGVVARGHEAGGWVGDDTSFILLQKLRGKLSKPLYIQGGVGIRTAAACRAAGAAGVVLDDSLLLMAESPLPAALQADLARLNGAECKLLGELLNKPCRVFGKPASAALKSGEDDSRAAEAGMLELAAWTARLNARIGWGADSLLPLGQGIGLAASYRDTYRSVGRLVQAVRRASLIQGDRAAELGFMNESGPLAKSHGTRFPLAQGPMTRVSDSPRFATAVAKGGALPFLALALMRGPQVAEMLVETRARVGDLPWGVGMLGFVPQALREEQCAEIWKCKPTFALIAGGRPDQAAEFEKHGIPTYIHAPAPALLRMYLEQGARRFVFEGRECGGHVGPLASFPLWEQMIEVLLAHVPAGEEKFIHILFAGGIHDAASGAMVAAMSAPLAERGMKIGCLMGTAYLFTHEVVSSGAVVEGFQAEAVRCERTMNLESGPGHASRCVDTKFAHDFYDTRRRLIREGRSSEEIREVLEDLNLGRLRIASKGVNRDDKGRMVGIGRDEQMRDGMYMIGQVATLRDRVLSVEALHLDVTAGAQSLLEARIADRVMRAEEAKPSDIAIVGIGVTLPKADNADDYWQLIVSKTSVIREAPKDRWDPELFYDANPKARDKVYSKWGGFLDEIPFDPMRFGIPPKSMKSIDTLQLLTLETAARTLADAGYSDGHFDRENTSVILGAGGGAGDLGVQYSMRAELPRFVENPSDEVWDRLPEWTEESFAGTLLNVAAGRVANRLDFGGVNFTVDAACGSSLAAINIAVHELESGRSAMVLAGGFDTTQSAFAFTAFAKTQALSARGQARTFDQSADGIAISEGVAMIALKRLADAERDGDRIYAVIKATAGSSDGKALGLTAPRSEGQVRALHRAYRKAGFSAATLGLAEAHGTGTPVGDRTEAQTIARALNEGHAAPKSVALGSVKTLLGHTKAAAGVSGLIKVALSLYHRVLPGHFGVEKPIEAIADPHSPVYLLKDARPWVAHPDHPRRGAASAFGFGGTNFHAVLEEYRGGGASNGSNRWPSELFLFRAPDVAGLVREVEKLIPNIQPGSRVKPASLASSLALHAEARRGQPATLAVVATDLKSLAADLAIAVAHLQGGAKPLPPSVKLNRSTPAMPPAVAFLFPGQGAQYVNMGREAALYFSDVREALEFGDRTLRDDFRSLLSSVIYPPAAFDAETESAQAHALTDTGVAQPAIGTLALGYLRLAERLGLVATAAAGHSYGEYAALMCAGVIAPADFLRLSAIRGRAMALASRSAVPGGMAAVQGRRERVQALITGFVGVRVANHNSPEQSVISGPKDAVEKAAHKLTAEGLRATLLPVSGAFHTELVAPAKAPLSEAIHATAFSEPSLTVYSNSTGAAYPGSPAAMQNLLDNHLLSGVEFVAEIEAMYAAGCRMFLELGPKGICSGMARQTLAGRDAAAVSLDANGGGLRGLLIGLAELFVAGVNFDAMALFAEREIASLDLAKLPEIASPAVYPRHWWMVSGGCARPIDDPVLRTGAKPALTKATAEAARAAIESKMEAAIKAKMPPPSVVASSVAAPSLTAPMVSAAPLSSEAMVAYQQTMRQFLALQERVVQQFLGGTASAAPMPAAAAVAVLSASASSPIQAVASPPIIVEPKPAQKAAPRETAAVRSPVAPDFKSVLLGIVSERTGYPTEMLGLDADLEADLGIDSIKRVEILGAFKKSLPAELASAVQGRMERFTRARSLNAILAEVQSLAPAPSAMEPIPAPAAASATASAVDIAAVLLHIVSDRTGYPGEMLGLEADLEADLGIDSIKRVEILGAFQKALPAEWGSVVQSRMERFTKAKSLAAILSEIASLAAAPVVTQRPEVKVEGAPVTPVATTTAARDFKADLLTIVAERTGYPSEMLGLDADLEADLGIDSIKRVEILGAFQKALPTNLAGPMQARMERFTKAKSLHAILTELVGLETIGPASPHAAAPKVAAIETTPAPASPPGRMSAPVADHRSLLLEIVAERTGYPTEMLGLDADLEADLGIDSIKRVEILGALQKALDADLAAAVQSRMERFTKSKSLAAILSALVDAATPAAAIPAPRHEPVLPAAAARPTAKPAKLLATGLPPLPRFVIKSRSSPLSSTHLALRGLALVMGKLGPITEGFVSELATRGLVPVVIAGTSGDEIRSAITAARRKHGPVQSLIHLQGLATDPIATLADWRELCRRDLLSLFHAVQAAIDDLPRARVIAASRLGGTFGRDAVGGGQPIAGGLNGMLNCLRSEYPECRARAVDFDGQTDTEIVRLLVAELLADDHETEAGYIGAERFGAATLAQPLAPSPFPPHVTPEADWVLLATGGARGVTAEVVEELVRPGMRVVLLGRTSEPAPEPAKLAIHPDAASLRRAVLAARLAQGDKPKPIEIDREVSRILVDREIRVNLARLRAAGATVDYVACDVRDEASFGGLIDALYARFGRIDAVIHGAGVIEDKLIADKTVDSFERVLGTKLDAAYILASRLRPESLKLLSFFTSVAGRYGNRGQTDYAAANEALNRLAWDLHRRWTNTRVVAVNWGPWDGGMASEGIKRGLRERGMEPIPVAAGRRFFLNELINGPRHDVELVAGEGPWANLAPGALVKPAATAPSVAGFPLVRRPPRIGLGGAVTLEHRLNLADDPYLSDHIMDGKPVLPMAAALEYMAQFVAAGWPEWQVAEIRDLRLLAGLVFDAEQGSHVILRARAATHSEPGAQAVTVEIVDARRKAGPNYRATAILTQTLPAAVMPLLDCPAAGDSIEGADAYARYLFHGERLRSVARVISMGESGAHCLVLPSSPRTFLGEASSGGAWLFDPALIDAASQMSFVWAHLRRTQGAVPSRMGVVRRFGSAPLTSPLSLVQRMKSSDTGNSLIFEAEYVDDSGRVRFSIGDGESAMSASLNRLAPSSPDYGSSPGRKPRNPA
ncbi:MAG: SDR family NAD(P)-dependent oxidoreductase [Panacagrimonas sp.]